MIGRLRELPLLTRRSGAKPYATAPIPTFELPKGIPYILGNELAERFSFYGMRAILVVFMTQYLLGADGDQDVMTEEQAKAYYHLFMFSAYFLPTLGALLSDVFLGKYRTILALSLVYCLGHAALAVDETRWGLAVGLTLIAIGAGGIKPCVSAHVGDQFSEKNKHLLSRAMAWFYWSINLGAFAATLLTPVLLEKFGPHVAFGVPGLLMLAATMIFYAGRYKFVHVPPQGMRVLREAMSPDGLRALANLSLVYVFIAVFFSLYDQTGSAWVLQAGKMNPQWLRIEWLPSQMQAFNPIFILVFIPLFTAGVYPAMERLITLTPLRKVAMGLFLAASPFALCGWLETRIAAGEAPSIGWQVLAYALLTAAEVLVVITTLEFSYTQAPRAMKSIVMSLFLLAIAAGNAVTAAINYAIQFETVGGALSGPRYYGFFTAIVFIAACAFLSVAANYRGTTYLQDQSESA